MRVAGPGSIDSAMLNNESFLSSWPGVHVALVFMGRGDGAEFVAEVPWSCVVQVTFTP